jgi:hypothetical protein
MLTLPRLTARLAVLAPIAALLSAACNRDLNGPSSPASSAVRVLSSPALPANGGPMFSERDDGAPPSSSPLGAGGSFTILGNAAVTCTNGTITGNVGTFAAVPTGAVTQTTCPIVGQIHVGDATAVAAYNAFLSAYTALAPKAGDVCPIITGTLAGQTFAPGVYCVSAEAKTGVVTLNGPASGTWTFKVAPGAFTGTSLSVVLAGGAQACNVTWWVDAAATMTDSDLKGSILAGAAITLTRGTLIGRAFAHAGVTVTGTAVTGCAAGAPGGGGGGGEGDDEHGDHDKRGDHDKHGHHGERGDDGEHGQHGERGHHGEGGDHGERGHRGE